MGEHWPGMSCYKGWPSDSKFPINIPINQLPLLPPLLHMSYQDAADFHNILQDLDGPFMGSLQGCSLKENKLVPLVTKQHASRG